MNNKTLQELLQLAENKKARMIKDKEMFFEQGDAEEVSILDENISDAETAIIGLKSLMPEEIEL